MYLYYTRIAPTLTPENKKAPRLRGFSGRGDRVRTCFDAYFTNKNSLFSGLFGFVLISQIGNFCPNIAPKLTQRCPNIRTIKKDPTSEEIGPFVEVAPVGGDHRSYLFKKCVPGIFSAHTVNGESVLLLEVLERGLGLSAERAVYRKAVAEHIKAGL